MTQFEQSEVTETAETPPALPFETTEETAESLPFLPDRRNDEPEPPPPASPATLRQRVLMFWAAALVILLDQFSKYLVETYLPLNTVWEPIPGWGDFIRITHTSNTGTAFGLFQGGSPFFAIVAILVSIALLYYNFTLPAGYKTLRMILGFQLGGALGNLIDRFRLGHVTDFIDIGPWYIFNLADAAIVFGALALAWLMWHEQPPQVTEEPEETGNFMQLKSAEESHSKQANEWTGVQ